MDSVQGGTVAESWIRQTSLAPVTSVGQMEGLNAIHAQGFKVVTSLTSTTMASLSSGAQASNRAISSIVEGEALSQALEVLVAQRRGRNAHPASGYSSRSRLLISTMKVAP
mmetsp:Transcript_50223/g.93858  ORF Transcript_50223/g.93858 Transcript_50223/m.93858 type:complete len:111 (-) Transcript_50223:912-1244(-)